MLYNLQTNNYEQVMGITFPTLSIIEILASNSLFKSSKYSELQMNYQ